MTTDTTAEGGEGRRRMAQQPDRRRPRLYHRPLVDVPEMNADDWRQVWMAMIAFQKQVELIVQHAKERSMPTETEEQR